jgi:hypothetical protein
MHYSLKEKKYIYDIPPFINNNNPFIYEQYISIPKSNNKLPLAHSLYNYIHVFIYLTFDIFYLIYLYKDTLFPESIFALGADIFHAFWKAYIYSF